MENKMKKNLSLRLLVIFCIALLQFNIVCAHAVSYTDIPTVWGGGKIWCDGSTGATVQFSKYSTDSTVADIGAGYTMALWVKNNNITNAMWIKFNRRESTHTVLLSNFSSASTTDFELAPGQELWLNPFCTTGFEAMGDTGVVTEGYLSYLGLFPPK